MLGSLDVGSYYFGSIFRAPVFLESDAAQVQQKAQGAQSEIPLSGVPAFRKSVQGIHVIFRCWHPALLGDLGQSMQRLTEVIKATWELPRIIFPNIGPK